MKTRILIGHTPSGRILASLLAATMLAGCVANPSQNRYSYKEVGQSAVLDFATVVSVRPIDIQGKNTGAGAVAGGTAGALGANGIGEGNGQAAAMIGGAVIGAIAGGVIEQQLANQKGYLYIVVTEHKDTKRITQYQNPDDVVFRKGDRVMIETKGTYQRLLPTDDIPETIQRPKGIKIVD
jgi:outer membrane lipoprotein SlyB